MRVAVISDVHFNDHDPLAWKLTKKIIPKLNLDLIYFLGDIQDFGALTRFMLDPKLELLLQQELDDGFHELSTLRDVYTGKIKMLSGNHEARSWKYVFANAKRLSTLRNLQIPNLLRLKELDIQYFDNSEKIFDKIGKLNFFHGDEIKIGATYPAKSIFNKIFDNAICGHFHRFDEYSNRSLSGEYHGTFVNGTLQKQDPRWAGHTNWDQGISVIDFSPTGYFDVDQIRYFLRGSKMIAMISSAQKELMMY